jgi:large subunit ribosomal protein L6
MSRIGQQPVELPDSVDVDVSGTRVEVSGPKGTLEQKVDASMEISVDDDGSTVQVERTRDTQEQMSLHGTTRSLIQNMVEGVSDGFSKRLEIHGTGYSAELKGDTLILAVGYTNDVEVDIPEGIEIEVPNEKLVEITGSDKQQVGQFSSEVRSIRPPEPYNQKGIRYEDEQVRSKEGKKFVSGV